MPVNTESRSEFSQPDPRNFQLGGMRPVTSYRPVHSRQGTSISVSLVHSRLVIIMHTVTLCEVPRLVFMVPTCVNRHPVGTIWRLVTNMGIFGIKRDVVMQEI